MNGKKIRFSSIADTVGFQLRRASHAMQLAYEAAFEPLGLRISETTVLISIGESPGCTQADLSRSLHIKPANLVPTISGLASKGFVDRVAGKGRSISLHLTEEGTARLMQVHEAIHCEEERIMELIAGADRVTILAALKTIAKKPGCRDGGE